MTANSLISGTDARAASTQSTKSAKSALRHNAFARRKLISPEQRESAGQRLAAQTDALIDSLAGRLTDRSYGLQPGATVATYVSMGTEIETRPLLNALLNARMRVIVPLLGSGLEIGWGELRSLDDLHAVRTSENATTGSGHLHQRPEEPSPLPPQSTPSAASQPSSPSSRSSEPLQSQPSPPLSAASPATLSSPSPLPSPTTPPATDATALRNASLIILPALAVDRHGTRLGRGGGWYDRALTYRAPNAPIIAVCWPWELVASDLPREPHDVPVDAILTPDGVTWLSVN
ncbi:5-formyltetrahydrofolate cyclo-ligase [Bifidobacterium hapali]|uniref:5-formyltetrahydrofolate cyclo-ligase n=1 Tax=Bifidobacterium hapali TaxID=1630172 RepID=A0A261FWN0_9BIFI|nr:5-formyltetrahydrofolate cyclo-ligase [Bifidobacterium hapali]OZG63589.1 5-formyltetrahydrofolate cyclo-ligase [Bifidobacterium hapali]